MLKVYHFILDHRVGGPHVYVKSIASALNSNVKSIIITAGKGPVTDISLVNIRHYWRPLYLFELLLNVLLIVILSLAGKISFRGSIFNVHGAINLAPLIAAWVLRVPVVWHFHETIPNYHLFVLIGRMFLTSLPHRLVAVVEKVANVYQLKKYLVLHAPIDLAFWSGANVSFGEIRKRALFNIVCVGNLNPLKGQDILLDALKDFPGNWELTIVGGKLSNWKFYTEKLEYQATHCYGITTGCKVNFVGWENREKIRERLAGCDVFVLPSRSEACPIVLLEAMAMGCVCVATNVGGVSEIINNSFVGYLVPPENPEAIRRALKLVSAMSNKDRILMSKAARDRAKKEFSLDEIAYKYLEVYKNLMN